MKRTLLSLFLFGVVFALCVSSAFALGPRDDGQECTKIKIVIRSMVDFETFTAKGVVAGTLEGTIDYVGDVTSVAAVSGDNLPPFNPALSFTGQATFITEEGSITTRNVGAFEPGPFGVGVEFGRVVDATGIYEGATGVIYFAVESDETGSNFFETGRGRICIPKIED